MVLRQETGKEQPVPVLVGSGLGEVVDRLGARARVQPVAERPTTGAQPVAELALLHAHVTAVLALMHREVLQRGPGGGLCNLAGLLGDIGEKLALVLG